MKFTLEIELGNDAMQTYQDIASSVRRIFSDFANRSEDANGNKVGTWEVSD